MLVQVVGNGLASRQNNHWSSSNDLVMSASASSLTNQQMDTEQASASDAMQAQLDACRAAWLAHRPSVAERRADLKQLGSALTQYTDRLIDAISEDFGHRPFAESMLGDIIQAQAEIKHTRAHLKAWCKRRHQSVGWQYWPGQAWLEYRPLGVIGIVSPWNYPLTLTLMPLASALAAGNHVMLKPSEYTPATNQVLAELIADVFPADKVAVVTGGPDVSAAFTGLAFDHLLFTGSTGIGKKVMASAAANLTPVTLELGGKSPAIVGSGGQLGSIARAIVKGKLFNAGQTCIAPDYVLVPKGSAEAFAQAARAAAAALYPDFNTNDEYTSIIHEQHYQRLLDMLAETARRGAKIIPLFDAPHDAKHRRITPALALHPDCELKLMQEEIFGPVLPVIEIEDIPAAIEFVNQRPRPLALYLFGVDRQQREQVLGNVSAGGVCIDDTLLHMTQLRLPFGGIGDSGMGQYHGRYGFEQFSKAQPVYQQSRLSGSRLFQPPFSGWKRAVMRWLAR